MTVRFSVMGGFEILPRPSSQCIVSVSQLLYVSSIVCSALN
jgi:hypothetical protein